MIAGIFDQFFGVPTHPFAVHAPIVLIPLLAIVSVLVLFKGRWREAAAVPLAGLALVMVAMLFFAKESGEALEESGNVIGDVDRHTELADQTFVLGIVWFVLASAAGVAMFVQRRSRATSLSAAAIDAERSTVVLVFNVLAAVAVVILTIWLIRTGHAGAASRWNA